MPRPSDIQEIVDKTVAEVLESVLPGVRAAIVSRAVAAVSGLLPARGSSPTELLSVAATAIQEAGSQAEILRQLLEGGARFAGRIALFVVKGGSVTGWQASGFADNAGIKNISLNAVEGMVSEAVQGRVPIFGATARLDPGFISSVKAPVDDNCLVLPLVVKDKVAALIYADGGVEPNGSFDASALSVLTRFAALWLEASTARKTGAGTAAVEEPVQAAVGASSAAVAAAGAGTGAGAASTSAAQPALSPEEADLHKKARRFAKLLVEEIMLYNQAKVAEGKRHRDLYARLREDIEKSRATYEKRYAESSVTSVDYFNQELLRILADNDASVMGNGFPR